MKINKTINDQFIWENWDKNDVQNVLLKIENIVKEHIEVIENLNDDKLSFKNIFKLSDLLSAEISKLILPLHIFEMLHLNEEIRNISRDESIKISNFLTEFSYNGIIYNKTKKYFSKNYKKEKTKLSYEENKIVTDTMKGYKKMGMHLDKKTRTHLIGLSNESEKISSDFNLLCTKSYESGLWFSKKDLEGVPENTIASFKYDEKTDKYFVSAFLRSHYRVIQKYATNKKTRDAITKKYEQGAGKINTKRLGEILKIRAEIAKILGFNTYGDMVMDTEMVSKPGNASKFLTDLADRLKNKYQIEKKSATKIMSAYKDTLKTSNILFAERIAQKESHDIDLEEFSKYFEYENTMKALFNIWEKYFDIVAKFERNFDVFGSDVEVYRFSDKKTGKDLGTAIFDLFPRAGKYGHACVSSLAPRFFDEDGNLHTTTGILICNFTKNKSGKTLLNMESVNTLFHEGGHLLHKILSKNNYVNTSAFNTSIDFVEIHSQFLENFATTKVAVDEVAKHFETGEKLPLHLKEKIEYLDDYFGGFMWTRQSVYSLFDLEIHGKNILKYAKNPENLNTLFNSLFKKYLNLPTITSQEFPSTFAHMTGGYASKYYGYSVSRAYSEDVWNEFVKDGLKKGEMTKKYKEMLETGNMLEEAKVLKKYLGRYPKIEPFVKKVSKI